MEGEVERRPVESFGEYLIRERTLRNIRLEEIAHKTRISLKILEALEANQHEALPGSVYVKGFLRAYAKHVGLDENDLVLRYEDYLQETEDVGPGAMERWRKRRGPVGWLLLVGVGLALALLYLLWPRSTPPPDLGTDQPVSQEEPRGPITSPEPAVPPRETIRSVPMPPPPQSSPGTPTPQGPRENGRERDPWEVRVNGPGRERP